MINSAIQEGINVRVIGSSGQTLFTRRGELLGFTSMSVTIRSGNTVYICNSDGSTQFTSRYQGGRTAYDDLVDSEESKPHETWTKRTVILYLLFGWLIKIRAGYRLYTLMGTGGDRFRAGIQTSRDWKDVGIWLMSVIFWIGCFWCYHEIKAWIN